MVLKETCSPRVNAHSTCSFAESEKAGLVTTIGFAVLDAIPAAKKRETAFSRRRRSNRV